MYEQWGIPILLFYVKPIPKCLYLLWLAYRVNVKHCPKYMSLVRLEHQAGKTAWSNGRLL